MPLFVSLISKNSGAIDMKVSNILDLLASSMVSTRVWQKLWPVD